MEPEYRIFLTEELEKLTQETIQNIATCYREVFNYFWHENWTPEEAYDEVKKGLAINNCRQPLLSIMDIKDKVVGFAWVILASREGLSTDDMPFGLADTEKVYGTNVVKYWCDLAGINKFLIFREIGISKDFQNWKGEHTASKLSVPLMKAALARGYEVLFYWTNPQSASFKQGLNFGWHPIHFFTGADRVIMKGSIRNLVHCLEGVLKKERQIFKEMNQNRKNYYCR